MFPGRKLLTPWPLLGCAAGLFMGAASFRMPDDNPFVRALRVLATPVARMLPAGNPDQDFQSLAIPITCGLGGAILGLIVTTFLLRTRRPPRP